VERYIDRGWSPEKHEHTRVKFYNQVYTYVGHSTFRNGLHVMLGGNCEDAKYLRDFWKISPQNMKIIERDRETANRLTSDGWSITKQDFFGAIQDIPRNRIIASINCDLTQTLQTLTPALEQLASHGWDNNFLCQIVYDIKRTRREILPVYQQKLNSIFRSRGIEHNRYQSWTLDDSGELRMTKGSPMGYVVYPI
jgi:hypothetical protein